MPDGSCNLLPDRVLDFACREHAFDAGTHHLVGDHIAVLVHFQLVRKQAVVWIVSNENKHTVRLVILSFARHNIAQPNALDLAVFAFDLFGYGVPDEVDAVIGAGTLLQGRLSTQRIATVNYIHLRRKFGQEYRFFDRAITATDDDNVLIPEEEAITGAAIAHTAPGIFGFARNL